MSRKKIAEFVSNGKFLVYLRVSTSYQALSGLGLMAQRNNCFTKGLALGLEPIPEHFDAQIDKQAGCFVDAGDSAYSKKFHQRPAGKKVLETAKRGDTLIVSRMDRAFRNVVDFVTVSGQLAEMGVRLIIVSPALDMGTAMGQAQAQMLAIVAEWESRRKGERISAALKVKKTRQLIAQSIPPTHIPSLPSEYRPAWIEEPTKEEEKEPGRVFIYIRCSHRDSLESGLGLLHQADVARDFAKGLLAHNKRLEMADVMTDLAVSAMSAPLRTRPSGARMDADLKRGDHVVFSTLDRGFRNIADMVNTITDWTNRGIHAHFAADGISMDDPGGKLMANVIAMFAQMEAESAQDRTREARAQLAGQGKFCGGHGAPQFWRIHHNRDGTKKLVLDKMFFFGFIYVKRLRASGLTLDQALIRLESIMAAREKRPEIPLSGMAKFVATRKLPPTYPRDKKGWAFPMMHHKAYDNAAPDFQKALAAWKRIAAAKRELRDKEVEPLPKARIEPRTGWPQDGTTSRDK